ncbi:MAG: biotin/lipoyl-binding protein [Bacilli bacterium]|nr:biotin/lipoyl-binding protein [Bacilli bacterium]MBR6866435.1 biotin/lipoyl-binding protein [Bacilli bacterium]
MKIYKVKVNGKLYEVELEEVKESAGSIAAPAAAPAATPAAAPVAGGTKVPAPMAGKILDIKVATGAKVAKGDTIAILEAMKLENEIKSPAAGTVKAICVQKGAMVNNGDALIVLE